MSGLPTPLLPLLRPGAYPHAVSNLRLIETHISWVLLTGELAYKLKRPVHYPFVDLRSPGRRAFLCAEEVRLNRRYAPQLYLGVSSIVVANGQPRMVDEAAAEDTSRERAVRMRQFDVDETLDQLIGSRRVSAGELGDFGGDLAAIHEDLPRVQAAQSFGTVDGVRTLVQANAAECRECAVAHGTAALAESLAGMLAARLRTLEPDIAARRRQGRVRECHGDLHARNVVRYQGRLLAFDCMEFEPAFRWIDVAEEVAFLWMDLRAKRRDDLALAFLAGYLASCGDFGACRVLRMYGAHRALVRAKVSALEAREASSAPNRAASVERHRAYLECARELLEPSRPRLVLMSGLSGSGKTWLARQLAPLLGAVHLRSDLERKRMAGLAPSADSHSDPGRGLYSPEANRRVYEHLERCAEDVLAGGLATIVDATFAHRAERELFRELARRRGCPMAVVHCSAPDAVLRARIAARHRAADDASEADLAVLDWQLAHTGPIVADEALDVIEADTTRAAIAAEIQAALAGAQV